jgi:TolA-binding protein
VRVCPYCGHNNEGEKICSYCEKDIKWLEVLEQKSEHYYRMAYIHGEKRELSKAIHLLKKSIRLNTYHIPSKNLLGLIELEIGNIGEALKLWILSTSLQKENNPAKEYLQIIQDDHKRFEKYKASLQLYNQALKYLHQKNEDVAMIRLKKAVSLNENFIEAKNLLAFCYIYQKQYHKAMEQVRSVLTIDKGNEKALYYGYLVSKQEEVSIKNTTKPLIEAPHLKDIKAPHTEYKNEKIGTAPNRLLSFTACFLLGGVCAYAVLFGLILPEQTSELQRQITAVQEQKGKVENALELAQNSASKEKEQLSSTILLLQNQNALLQEEKIKIEQKSKLMESVNLANQNNWTEAAKILYNISVSELSEDEKKLYDATKERAYEKAATTLYNEGYISYTRKQSVEAMEKFEKVVLYMPGSWAASQALYYMGEMQESENIEKAKQYYNLLLEEYAGTSAANKAKRRIDAL